MRFISSICMMPSDFASERPTGIVATVISAPVTMCWVTTFRKSIRYNWSPLKMMSWSKSWFRK